MYQAPKTPKIAAAPITGKGTASQIAAAIKVAGVLVVAFLVSVATPVGLKTVEVGVTTTTSAVLVRAMLNVVVVVIVSSGISMVSVFMNVWVQVLVMP